MFSSRVSQTSSQSFTVQVYAQAASRADTNGEMSGKDVKALVKFVQNSPEQLSKANFKEIAQHNAVMQPLVQNSKNAAVLAKALNMVESRVVSAEAKAAAAEAKSSNGIVTDQKTVRFAQVKSLDKKLTTSKDEAKELLTKLADPSGWKRPKQADMALVCNKLFGLAIEARDLKTQIESSSYKHNPGKTKTLDKVIDGAMKTLATTDAKFMAGVEKNNFTAKMADINRKWEERRVEENMDRTARFYEALNNGTIADFWPTGMGK